LGLYPPGDCDVKLDDFQQKNARLPFEVEGMDDLIAELGDDAIPG